MLIIRRQNTFFRCEYNIIIDSEVMKNFLVNLPRHTSFSIRASSILIITRKECVIDKLLGSLQFAVTITFLIKVVRVYIDGYWNKDIIKNTKDANIKRPKTFQEKPSQKTKAETEQKITFNIICHSTL